MQLAFIGNIYKKSSIIFVAPYFRQTQPIFISSGAIQGDTLNPYFFLIFLELPLQWLEKDNYGYDFNTSNAYSNSTTYADSLSILSQLLSHLHHQIIKLEHFNEWNLASPNESSPNTPTKPHQIKTHSQPI